jgi:predicted secreted protein
MIVRRRIAMASLMAPSLMILGVAACATPSHPSAPPQPSSSSALPAPTPSDVPVHISQAQAGQTIDVRVGQRFAVELVGVPTAGYVWAAKTVPAFLTAGGETSGPTTEAQRQPGFAGGNHWEVTMFTANAPGEGELVFEQRRPWETSEPPSQTFQVTIRAR